MEYYSHSIISLSGACIFVFSSNILQLITISVYTFPPSYLFSYFDYFLWINFFPLSGIGLAVPNSGFGASSIYGLEGYQELDGDDSGERLERTKRTEIDWERQ